MLFSCATILFISFPSAYHPSVWSPGTVSLGSIGLSGVPGRGRGILFSRWERRKGNEMEGKGERSLGAAFCFEVGVEEIPNGMGGTVRRLDGGKDIQKIRLYNDCVFY